MKKEIVISAKMDNEAFDKSIDDLKRKLKEIYQPSDMIRAQGVTANRAQQQGFNGLSAPSQEAFQKATSQQRRDQDTMIREQLSGQEKLGKQIAARMEQTNKLKAAQAEMVKDSEKELALKEKISRVEENTAKMREMYMSRNATLGQSLNARANPPNMPPYPAAPPGGGYNGPQNTSVNGGWNMSLMGGAGHVARMGAGILGAAGTAIGFGSNMYRAFGNAPITTASAMGSAVQGTLGRDVGNAYGGRTAFEGLFNPERMKALGMSKNAMDTTRTSDKVDLFTSMMKQAGMGAVGGSLVGGLPGAVIGGVGGAISGAFGDSRRRSLALSPFSNTMNKQYESTLFGEYANNYSSSYQGLKDQNPNKKFAMEDFEKNMGRNVGAQRSMGLSNDQFYGDNGYLKGVTNAGFTHDQGIGMSNSILGAGGSSRMARESGFGLQMERMGMTNSGDVLGKLSGSIQSPDSAKRATIAIMSEAMSAGLDNSDFAEENRKFTSAAANIISRTGATGEGDQTRIAQMLGQFLGERTNAGVQSAGNAYESFQERGSQLGGRRGTLRMVSAMKDPVLSKLGQNDLTEALSIRPEDRNENNPELQSFARTAGVSGKDFISSLSKADRSGRFELPGQQERVEKAAQRVKDKMKATGKSKEQLAQEGDPDVGELQAAQRMTATGSYNRSDANAAIGEELPGITGFGPTNKEAVTGLLNSSSRKEDKFNQGAAGDSEFVRKNFSDMSGEMNVAAEAAAKMTSAVRQMAIEFQAATAKSEATKSAVPMDEFLKKFGSMGDRTQSQSGKDRR